MAYGARTVIATSRDGAEEKVNRKDLTMGVHCYAVITRDDKVLISPQWEVNGFVFPGGSVELGENHLDGLAREVFEETGYAIKAGNVIDVFTSIFLNFKTNKAQHNILIYYAADVLKGHISTDGFDKHEKNYASKARWVTFQELRSMKFACNTQQPIKTLLNYLEIRIGKREC